MTVIFDCYSITGVELAFPSIISRLAIVFGAFDGAICARHAGKRDTSPVSKMFLKHSTNARPHRRLLLCQLELLLH